MNGFKLAAFFAAFALCAGASQPVAALDKSDPVPGEVGGIGSGPGPGDPSLGGTGMPPGGDKAGVAAAERAEKIAERKRLEADRKKEEERQRREAEAAKAQADKQKRIAAALAPKQSVTAVTPIMAIASAPMAGTHRSTIGASRMAPSSLGAVSR